MKNNVKYNPKDLLPSNFKLLDGCTIYEDLLIDDPDVNNFIGFWLDLCREEGLWVRLPGKFSDDPALQKLVENEDVEFIDGEYALTKATICGLIGISNDYRQEYEETCHPVRDVRERKEYEVEKEAEARFSKKKTDYEILAEEEDFKLMYNLIEESMKFRGMFTKTGFVEHLKIKLGHQGINCSEKEIKQVLEQLYEN